MTTATWTSRVRHDSDAVYQEWRDEFITKLGVMVTAGTLAADETTVSAGAGARPGTNTEQAYAVYHLSDSLHGTAPIYIRFGFGTGSTATAPRIQITTGTSTNGSGVLGGTALATISSINDAGTAQTTDTTRTSYMCAVAGFFGFHWKTSAAGIAPNGYFFIARTVDSAGAITATGSIAYWGSGGASNMAKVQAFRYAATAAAYTAKTSAVNGMLGFFAQNQTGTLVSGSAQAAVAFTYTPRIQPIVGVMGVLEAEASLGTTFTCTPVGTTSRTYIALSNLCGPFSGADPGANAGHAKHAMLWE